MDAYFGDFRISNLIFQRALAAVYLIAFVAALNQFPALLGEKGFLPVTDFIKRVPFKYEPSLFYFGYSDRLFAIVAWAGILLSGTLLCGLFDKGPWWVLSSVWLGLWVLYLSIVDVGQTFYAFGWETMLLETGFFAAFLGPAVTQPSLVPVMCMRWILFRLILGAGLIKLRNDPCWRDLSCLFYHYETQPLPNPFSWYFHQLPKLPLMIGVAFNHFVEVIVPFGLLGPQPVAAAAGAIIILFQLVLISGGNYVWLNLLTIVLAVSAFSDAVIGKSLPFQAPLPAAQPRSEAFNAILAMLAVATVLLSIQPVLNLFSSRQAMNRDYNALHLVNSYGVFGTITKERYEIVIEGTRDTVLSAKTRWKEYEFKGKPGDIRRMPPQIAPYHLRLDWVMWFLPFSVEVGDKGIFVPGFERWFLRFMEKLLEGDPGTLKLLGKNPFPDMPPHYIRAGFYLYQFTDWKEKKATGAWWKRKRIDDYLPPVTLSDLKEI